KLIYPLVGELADDDIDVAVACRWVERGDDILDLGVGLPVNLKRVARLMRAAGIQGLYRRRPLAPHC
ncbi:MAG TPA: IS3 family transposase, partial [Chloroflexota bacterium]|nr:IS3 family transposase [Chloroflexota bacterium]